MSLALRTLGVLFLCELLASCTGAAPAPSALDDRGLSLADHVGPTLVIASLEPARVGDNIVHVFFRDAGGRPSAGSARVSLQRQALEVSATSISAGDGARVAVPSADEYELLIDARPDGAPAGVLSFPLRLPTQPPTRGLLARLDAAMNGLHTLRESQTLTSGSFVYVFAYEYQAPDRVRYRFNAPDGEHETVIVGGRRFDREAHAGWTESDLGSPTTILYFNFAAALRVREIGEETLDGRATLVLALVLGAPPDERYYRLWVDSSDLRIRRYTMMASGHYMTGTYRDFNAPIEIDPPSD